jgi:transposase-like protein
MQVIYPGGAMPQNRAVAVMLSAGERKVLKKRARGAKTTYRDWLRAQIVLAAARGRASARIAAGLHVSADTVRKWRGRFAARGLDGLADLPRSGRPRRISALERAAVVALACQLASPISPSSVLRILAEHPIKPWRYQSWIYPRDPDFAAKATVILDLYQGKRLRPATGSSRWTPSPRSRPAADAAQPARQHAGGRCASSTNTSARAPSPCWPP